jgi:hypothetical protein
MENLDVLYIKIHCKNKKSCAVNGKNCVLSTTILKPIIFSLPFIQLKSALRPYTAKNIFVKSSNKNYSAAVIEKLLDSSNLSLEIEANDFY